jgi:hypothetical protein
MTDITQRQRQRQRITARMATSDPKWETYAAGTGLIAAAFMLASYLMLIAADMPTSAAALPDFYADEGKRNLLIASWLMVCFGAAFSVWFLGTLRSVLRRAEGDQGRVSGTAYGAGIASVVMFVIGSSLIMPIAGSLRFDNDFAFNAPLDVHVQSLLNTMSYGVLAPAGILAAVLVGGTALVTMRTAVFPQWFAIASVVTAVLLLLTPFLGLLPVVLIPLWTIAASVLCITEARNRDRVVDVTTPSTVAPG